MASTCSSLKRVTAVGQPRFVADENAELLDLRARQLESASSLHLGLVAVARTADDADEFIEVRQRDEVAFERLGALLGLAQFKARAAQDDFAAMLDVAGDERP